MTEDRGHGDPIAALVARVLGGRGEVITAELAADEVDELVQRLDGAMDDACADATLDYGVRLVLGSACTTAARAVDQIVAALRLPYRSALGWGDFLDALGERPISRRECVVVADASQVLKHEDYDLWRELVDSLRSGPHCMGGGWSTLVLTDHEFAWQDWTFNTMTDGRPGTSPA